MGFATALALGSAVVHAAWNLLIKTGDDREMAAWGQFAAAGLVSVVGLFVVGLPGWGSVPYLVASALVHVVYLEALVGAYTHGDYSLSYPLARGTGAVLAALGSVVFLDDSMRWLSWVAIGIAAVGLASLRVGAGVAAADDVVVGSDVGSEVDAAPVGARVDRGAIDRGAIDRGAIDKALVYALACGCSIATYSLVDSAGSREASDGVSYAFAICAAAGLAVTLQNAMRPARRARARSLFTNWKRNLAGGVGTVTAYTLVLVAVRHAPVGYVTMLRESSVVLGAAGGWLLLGERLGGRRLVSAVVISAGLALLVAAGG